MSIASSQASCQCRVAKVLSLSRSYRCKPKKCRQECKKSCPVVKIGKLITSPGPKQRTCVQQHDIISSKLVCAGKLCIEVAPTSKVSWISEELCIGCGICVKVWFEYLSSWDVCVPVTELHDTVSAWHLCLLTKQVVHACRNALLMPS